MAGKVCLVTGAARGIGAATAALMLAEGARSVVVTDVDGDGAARTARRLGPGATAMTHDVAREGDWARVVAGLDRLDVLVNNAAISAPADIEAETLDHWRSMQAVNADSVFLGMKLCLPLLRESAAGAIVNVASALGVKPVASHPAYAASKAAVRMLTKTTALHCARKGYPVRVNCVLPGSILTPMVERTLGDTQDARAANLKARAAVHPIGRLGSAEEVARAIVFLASEEASFITGADLAVDGGLTL